MKRIATIIIKNERGDFFVHQRSEDKKTFPSLFGLGAGGHIEDGEAPDIGAARELLEETGIDQKPKFLFDFEYKSEVDSYPVYVFLIETKEDPSFEEKEWQWSGWMSVEKSRQLARGEKTLS